MKILRDCDTSVKHLELINLKRMILHTLMRLLSALCDRYNGIMWYNKQFQLNDIHTEDTPPLVMLPLPQILSLSSLGSQKLKHQGVTLVLWFVHMQTRSTNGCGCVKNTITSMTLENAIITELLSMERADT